MKKILIGTHNNGKFKEISALISKDFKKFSPIDKKISSPKETGKTFFENSRLKANYFCKHSKMISISDDSGIEIKCLNNKPGIYSARWAKKYGGFKKAMYKILKMVDKKNKNKNKKKDRRAKFVCCLSLKFPNGKIISATGCIYGTIAKKIKGLNGFGYDPIFIPKKSNLTYAEMSRKKKNNSDHRFVAFRKLKKKIKI